MTIYDLLRRLVELAAMQEPERHDATKLIEELEELNALGTVAKQTEAQAHECIFERTAVGYRCTQCGKTHSGSLPTRNNAEASRVSLWP